MRSHIILAAIIAATVLGDYALKTATGKDSPLTSLWFLAGTLLYAATAIGWLYLMRSHNLAYIGILYSAATIVSLTIVGFTFFEEEVSRRQLIALSAALVSVVMAQQDA